MHIVTLHSELAWAVRICRSSCNTDSLDLRDLVFSGGALTLHSSEYNTQDHDFTHTKFARALTSHVFSFSRISIFRRKTVLGGTR